MSEYIYIYKSTQRTRSSSSSTLSQHPQEQRYPFLSVRAVFSCLQTMVWPPVFEIFNERTDADAGDCTRGQRHGQDSAVGLRVDPRLPASDGQAAPLV